MIARRAVGKSGGEEGSVDERTIFGAVRFRCARACGMRAMEYVHKPINDQKKIPPHEQGKVIPLKVRGFGASEIEVHSSLLSTAVFKMA